MGKQHKTVTPVRRLRMSDSYVKKEDFINLLMQRERLEYMLHSINGTADALLGSMDNSQFEASLLTGMQITAATMDVERIYIWKNEVRGNELVSVNLYGWVSDPEGDTGPTKYSSLNYHRDNPVWEEKLRNGEYINGPVNTLSVSEQMFLNEYNVVSILVLPVFLEQHFWGFVSFDELKRERVFSHDEINILYTYALMMISALHRNIQTAKLHKAYRYSQLMLDATPLSCRIWDKDLNLLDCNEAAVKLFQMSDKEEYIRRYRECSPMYQPDGMLSTDKTRKLITSAFREGYCQEMYMYQLPSGEYIPTEVTLVRVETDNGADIVATYSRDLREYRKMMSEIEQRDLLLSTAKDVASILLQAEPDTISDDIVKCLSMMTKAANADRSHIWQNSITEDGRFSGRQLYEWANMGYGISAEEYSGVPYADYFPEIDEYLAKGKFVNGSVNEFSETAQRFLTKFKVRSCLLIPVFLNGQFWGFVGFNDTHIERKYSENEESILHSGSLLIASALQRNYMTQNLQDSAVRLENALKDAQAASQAKSNFLSNMSHEIRTPINAITGMTAIGKAASGIERKNYAFEKIEGASTHLLGVINDILDMSKIEAEKFELSMIDFNFKKMIQKVIDVFVFRVDEKHQHLTIDLDDRIPAYLFGDDQRLSQVITNLLGNSIKFTPEGKNITLTAKLVSQSAYSCRIRVSVEDSGIGISAQNQKMLFTSFNQAENNTSRKFGGTGLGLAISKRIVDLMGGGIWVESSLGKGAKFTFEVELSKAKEEPGGGKLEEETVSSDDMFKGMHMLLAEDMEINREIVAAMLEFTGLEIDFAANGSEAIAMFENAPDKYDIILMDIQMPEIDGLEATRLIRALPAERAKTVPIVAMSANVFREDIEKCLEAGMDGHMGKPLDFAEVLGKIKYYTSLK